MPLAFLQVLKAETMKFQASHPDREAEIARASALITLGMVTPAPEDPETGQVLSSDGRKVYHVNGSCTCEAGQHGRACKHISGWKLYQHVQRKMAAQSTTEDIGAGTNISPLPEARASCNVRLLVHGHECQWTLRGHDEAEVFARLASLVRRPDVQPLPAKPAPRSGTNWKQRGR